MKKCTCQNDKTDPNCPVCNEKVDYLKDFHRLNPEAKPPDMPLDKEGKAKAKAYGGKKTAELFKLSTGVPTNLLGRITGGLRSAGGGVANAWKGLSPEMQGTIKHIGQSAIMPAAASAVAGGLMAEPGHAMEGALKGGLVGGGFGAGVGAMDRMMAPKVASQFYSYGKAAALAAYAI